MSAPVGIFYHQLVNRPRPTHAFLAGAITPDQFRRSMVYVKERFRPLGMDELRHIWRHGKRWPARAVFVSFDDGFRNNLWAARILHELDMSATFFVLSDVVDTGFIPTYLRFAHIVSTRRGQAFDTPWGAVDFERPLSRRRWGAAFKSHLLSLPLADRSAALDQLAEILKPAPIDPDDEDLQFLTASDLREMVALGMSIGGHGATHGSFSRCNDEELRYEIVASREKLAALAGCPIDTISYPDGRFDERVLNLVRRHYEFGFAASASLPTDNQYAYPRRCTGVDVRKTLRPWYPLRIRAIRLVKRLLGVTERMPQGVSGLA